VMHKRERNYKELSSLVMAHDLSATPIRAHLYLSLVGVKTCHKRTRR